MRKEPLWTLWTRLKRNVQLTWSSVPVTIRRFLVLMEQNVQCENITIIITLSGPTTIRSVRLTWVQASRARRCGFLSWRTRICHWAPVPPVATGEETCRWPRTDNDNYTAGNRNTKPIKECHVIPELYDLLLLSNTEGDSLKNALVALFHANVMHGDWRFQASKKAKSIIKVVIWLISCKTKIWRYDWSDLLSIKLPAKGQ